MRIKRLSYRKGYGIHSPYAFQLVTQVIYGKPTAQEQRAFSVLTPTQRRSAALIVRISKAFSNNALRLSDNLTPAIHEALQQVVSAEKLQPLADNAAESIVWISETTDLPTLQNLISTASSSTIIALQDIHTSPAQHLIWQTVILDERVRVSMDLYDLGLLIFQPKLQKQNYLISF